MTTTETVYAAGSPFTGMSASWPREGKVHSAAEPFTTKGRVKALCGRSFRRAASVWSGDYAKHWEYACDGCARKRVKTDPPTWQVYGSTAVRTFGLPFTEAAIVASRALRSPVTVQSANVTLLVYYFTAGRASYLSEVS